MSALVVPWLLAIGLALGPPVAEDAFEQAVAAYQGGDHAVARELFAEAAASEPDAARRAVLHANAGTAAARADQHGLAVWHLEAALRLAPRDRVARRNLDQVRVGLGQATRAAGSFAATVQRLPVWLTRDEALTGLSLLATLGLLCIALARAGVLPGLTRRLAWPCLVLAALWWALDGWARELDERRAVVLRQVVVRAEPDAGSRELFRLDPGVVVRDEEQRDVWRLIETEAGGRGWTPAESVRPAGG